MSNPILTHLSRVIEICDAATPGPWKLWAMEVLADTGGDSDLKKATPVAQTYFKDEHGKDRTFNAQFIAHARASLPQLAKALQRAIEALEYLSSDWYRKDGLRDWKREDLERMIEVDTIRAEDALKEISALLGLAGDK